MCGGLGSQFLFNACKHVLEGGAIPAQFAASRTVFIPKSSDVDDDGLIVRSPDALYVQKAAQAADEAWQQTIAGVQGPGVTNPTIATLEHPSSAAMTPHDYIANVQLEHAETFSNAEPLSTAGQASTTTMTLSS